jgi:hypothetical protein
MSQDFVRPASPAWTALVENSSSVEEMREAMKAKLAADGFILRERGYEVGSDTLTREAEDAAFAASPASPDAPPLRDTCIRVLYLRGNSRFEIVGPSEENLDDQEAKLRALYRCPK